MHLKTLTLRGFKSFASATTLDFEPGVTCVVGPNGSGKSNVVDALSWVMGEQGAKSLRGGKMEDVIFAGTSTRPALGRAEVRLTIDNTDGALPIEYTEVTISRTLFRNGGSEYAINGTGCRLLDIQDLLSDSGLGREMHVIVGQGQLDAILSSTPEERRGFIEEAAGVLKHRKRKERALRKLDAMQGNLTRAQDLTAEIRRQLGPLARQADVARRAQVIQAELRDARARLLADELVGLTSQVTSDEENEAAIRQRRAEVEALIAAARDHLAVTEREAAEAAPRISEASEVFFRLSSLRERLRGTARLAAERHRLLGAVAPPPPSQDVSELEAQAVRLREAEAELAGEVAGAREALEDAVATREEAEDGAESAERRHAAQLRAAADRREGIATLAGQVAAARSRAEARESELDRLRRTLATAQEAAASAQREFTALETQAAGVEEGEEDLDSAHEAAELDARESHDLVERLTHDLRASETARAGHQATFEALSLSITRKDGAGALLAAGSEVPGVMGSLAALLEIEPGCENAVAMALGVSADAVVVESVGAAVDAIRYLRTQDLGRVNLVVAGSTPGTAPAPVPDAGRRLSDVVAAPQSLAGTVAQLLSTTVMVDDLVVARRVVESYPTWRAVTKSGDLVAADVAGGGSATSSVLELQATYEAAERGLAQTTAECERLRFELAGAQTRLQQAEQRVEVTLDALNESDARLAAVAERLGRLGSQLRAATAEAQRAQESIAAAQVALADDHAALQDLTQRLEHAQADGEDIADDVDSAERDRAAALASAARQRETEARLALRTAEERLRALSGRAEAIEAAAAAEREAARVAAHKAERRREQAQVAGAVAAGAEAVAGDVDIALERAQVRRDEIEQERARREAELASVRAHLDELSREMAELTDVVHRDEVARAQQRLRIEALQERSISELGLDPDVLVAEFGPEREVPPPPLPPGDEEPDPPRPSVPYVREEQEKRARRNERALAQLGKVNPLALEEYAALEERHQFLTEQLNDLKKSRADLLEVIREVDERVEQVFTEAYRDTEEAFGRVFARLFPGGEGRLVLTDPQDMLLTGIEVEARPAGKQVKRLSLLSGGERSLVAVAFMVAIFMARPSPFYVMDEVEAALDDTNLGRLLEIFSELRRNSQIIIVTHQKRTMEIADALYGVTMRGDGVTTVISQRLQDTA